MIDAHVHEHTHVDAHEPPRCSILAEGGTPLERVHAKKIIPLRENGNLLLCTLLLGNTVVNAFLAILLAELSSGWIGLATSSLLIVSCGEILPQSLCVKHGLKIGSSLVPVVRFVTMLLFPLTWPISKVLDLLLGEDMGNVYNIQKLKRLIAIHAENPEAQQVSELTPQDKKFLMGALEYRDKSVSDVMTSIGQTYCLDIGEKLDFQLMVDIYKCGFTRIPVFESAQGNIVGILYVKDLILLDPEDEIELKSLLTFHGKGVDFVDQDTPLGEVFKMFIKGLSHIMVAYERDETNGGGSNHSGVDEMERTPSQQSLVDHAVDCEKGEGGKSAAAAAAATKGVVVIDHGEKQAEKKHVYSVSKYPKGRVVGIITLEDVLEEVLQTEIVDETDQYESNASDRRIARKGEHRHNIAAFLDVVNPKQWKEERISVQEMKAITSFLCMNVAEFRRFMLTSQAGAIGVSDRGTNIIGSNEVLENLIRRSRIIEYHDVDDNSAGASNANVDTSPNTKLHHSQMSGANGEEIYPLYKKGKATNVFSLVLSGKVIVRAGVERFESDLGPWSFLGSNSMVQPAYVPDFDADAIRPFRILQISRSDFLAATRATLVRHKTLDAKQRRRLSKQQASGASAAPAMASNASARAASRSLGEHDGVGTSDVRIEESDDEGPERHGVYDQDGQRQHRSSSDGHLHNRRTRASSGEYLSSIDDPGNQSDVL